jgi:glycine hydroxymethyltransferase
VPHAQIVTTTTHKTLRGPRGGMILCTSEFTEAVDKGCPIILGGPLPHVLAAKAVALREASEPSFRDYAKRIVQNSQALAEGCLSEDMQVLTGGTDNHLLLLDVHKSFGLTGRQAESAIRECHMTLNRNALPFDENGPWYTSGLRVGTPAATTLGMTPSDMREVARVFKLVLSNTKPSVMQKGPEAGQPSRARYAIGKSASEAARERVAALLDRYPVYPEIDLDLVRSAADKWGEASRPTVAAVH